MSYITGIICHFLTRLLLCCFYSDSYTHDIEAVSCDEMLVDCTDLIADTGASAELFAQLLRKDIEEKTGCYASAGIGIYSAYHFPFI